MPRALDIVSSGLDQGGGLFGLLDAVEAARLQGDAGAMIRGWSEIGRLMGYYAPERQIKIHANIAAKRVIDKLETLSDQELLKLVEVSQTESA